MWLCQEHDENMLLYEAGFSHMDRPLRDARAVWVPPADPMSRHMWYLPETRMCLRPVEFERQKFDKGRSASCIYKDRAIA
jgi:hypothetical protein